MQKNIKQFMYSFNTMVSVFISNKFNPMFSAWMEDNLCVLFMLFLKEGILFKIHTVTSIDGRLFRKCFLSSCDGSSFEIHILPSNEGNFHIYAFKLHFSL